MTELDYLLRERANIMEYDGHMERSEAERKARLDVIGEEQMELEGEANV